MSEPKLKSLCGMLVSEAVYEAALKDWPKRPPTGYSDDRTWLGACTNHVLLVAREMGEEPPTDPDAARM